jgi:Fe2+ transport system protein FeoA
MIRSPRLSSIAEPGRKEQINERRTRMTLLEAPANTPLRIKDLVGGEGFRRRLLALGFHRDDLVRLDSRALFKGPILVWNLRSGTQVALGRGVAQKIIVETDHGAP